MAGKAKEAKAKRELFSDAERILAKTGSGMSLMERLARDETLRIDMLNLINELGAPAAFGAPL